jgi:hypothetical protein
MLDFKLDITNLSPSNADTCFFTDTFHVNLNPGTILGTENINQSWSVYPNPSNGITQIQLPVNNGLLSIYDNTGKCIHSVNVYSKQIKIEREILPHSGLYHLVWNSANSTKSSHKTLIILD